ncbi:MAG: D-2-hydroxyacid dehydrogenase [Gammaproteobacteria bacterium]|nr:D-2-hydroxyacid dehydrogenase [Gammaproteobacteria bacterium]
MNDGLKQAVMLDLKATDRGDLSLDSLYMPGLAWQLLDNAGAIQLPALIKDKEIVVTNKVLLDRALLEQADQLKLICICATGTNNVDLDAARERGIDVCNVTSYASASVVQYVFAVLLNLMSRLTEHQQAVQAGAWSSSKQFCLLDYPFKELEGKVLGIVGYGELGQAVASVAKAFGMKVMIAARNSDDKRPGRWPLAALLPQLDVLSLHCPLTNETRHLIAKKELQALPKGAIVINSARGGIVDEEALLKAIEDKHLAGAATDVLSTEPPEKNHRLLQKHYPNLIITPHIAWASTESRQRLIDQVALNIASYLAGRPRNIVN